MSKRFAQVIILVEDKQQQTFVRRLLVELDFPIRKLMFLPLPAGEGSGEAYVREQYPIQVRELRPRAKYQDVALVVAIDGDVKTLAERRKQLADQLDAAGLEARAAEEKIVHLIPCRNVETWIAYLGDVAKAIDETTEYPKLKGRERECQTAVEELVRLYKADQLPANCPPALAAAIVELRRLVSEK